MESYTESPIYRISGLQDYMSTYKADIDQESMSEQYKVVSDCLQTIFEALFQTDSQLSPEANAVFTVEMAIEVINSLDIPQQAKTAERVFRKVILKELKNCFEHPPEDETVSQDLVSTAKIEKKQPIPKTIYDLPNEIKVDILRCIPRLSSLLLTDKQWKVLAEWELSRRYPKEIRNTITYVKALAQHGCFNGAVKLANEQNLVDYDLTDIRMFGFALQNNNFPLMCRTFQNLIFKKPIAKWFSNTTNYEKYNSDFLQTTQYVKLYQNQFQEFYINFTSNLEMNIEMLAYSIKNKFIRTGMFGNFNKFLLFNFLRPLITQGLKKRNTRM